MDVITVIFFDGQFWTAFIEKIDSDGTILIGKYTFGPEPTNTELLAFYLYKYHLIRCEKSASRIRIKAKRANKEVDRITTKAKDAYRELQAGRLGERKKTNAVEKKQRDENRYALKQAKKKEKRKGH